MKRLFVLSILIMMMVYNECSKCTEYKEQTNSAGQNNQNQDNQNQDAQTPNDQNENSNGRRRRLVVEEKTCSALPTSDDKKKKCVVNKDKTGCEEVDKDSSSMIKIPLFLLISLLFI